MIFIGIDGGGTKTKFTAFSEEGDELDSLVLGSCHFMQVNDEAMKLILKEGIETLCKQYSNKEFFVCAGMGGYGRDERIRKRIEDVYQTILPCGNYKLYSDAEIAVAGALGSHEGIVVIAGTGSIAFSKIDNQFNRAGGWGYILGDEGSAYWLGKKALSIFCKEADGRLPKGALYTCFMDHFQLERDFDLIMVANEKLTTRTDIASLSKIVYQAALLHDENAIQLFKEAADELVSLIDALNVKEKSLKVSYVGGLFAAKDILIPMIQSQLNDNLTLIEPAFNPEKGAYLLGYIEIFSTSR